MQDKKSQIENKSLSSFSERISAFLQAKNMRAADLTRATGIPGGALSQILSGARPNPGFDYLVRIVSNSDISAEFLLTGIGSPIRQPPAPSHHLTADAVTDLLSRANQVLGSGGLQGRKRDRLLALMVMEVADGKSVDSVIRWAEAAMTAGEDIRTA